MVEDLRRLLFFFPIVISTLLMSCAGVLSSRKIVSPFSPDALWSAIETHASRLHTFNGWGRLMIATPDGGFRGMVNITVKMPDSLVMRVEGPLGIDVLRGVIGSNRAFLYYPRDNVAYSGTIQELQESTLLPIDAWSLDVVSAVLGLHSLKDKDPDGITNIEQDGRQAVLRFLDDEEVVVEYRGPVVTRWERRTVEGGMIWEWEAKQFIRKRGLRLPRLVRMTHHLDRQRVTLFYERVKPNVRLERGWSDFKMPAGVDIIEL